MSLITLAIFLILLIVKEIIDNMKCPGSDTQFWTPYDIFEIRCQSCSSSVEFFKDDGQIRCRNCGELYNNPKLKENCFEYCKFGKQCKEHLNIGKLKDL